MKPSIQKLQKFFKLEAERGYDDRAVVGGLERMLGPWEAEARADGLEEEVIAAVVTRLRDYHRLSPTSRQEALQGLWRRMQRGAEPETTPAPHKVEEQPAEAALSLEAEEVEIDIEVEVDKEEPAGEAGDDEPEEPELAVAGQQTSLVSEPRPAERRPSGPPPTPSSASPPAALQAQVTVLQGVGPRHGQTLARLGLQTLGDLLYYFPRRYDDYSRLKPVNRLWYGDEVTIIGTVQNVGNRPIRSGRLTITEAVVSDGTGALRVTWFNQPWITKRIRGGMQVVLSGKIDQYLGRLVMNNPEIEPLEQQNLSTNRIVPVYPLTANITQRWLRRLMHQVVTYWSPRVQDPIPPDMRRAASLIDLSTALIQAHFPDSFEQLKAARHRLAFDEIFLLQLGLLRQKRSWQEQTARVFSTPEEWLAAQLAALPFHLTDAQQRALAEVRADLESGRPMNRLLQGDVGSGKTVVAALAVAMVAHHGAQAALMAPTSILAEQHYRSLLNLLAGEGGLLQPGQVRLLVGATPEVEKRAIRDGLASGEILLLIGTHALIEDPVVFADLQLTIVDEQHRFGVEQRAALRNKGENPHLMVMTATPIPRSLALTVYGDLDLTVMDEMPPGRQEVSTHVLLPRERERAYSLIRSQLAQGRQAFIIYPLVEEGSRENSDGDENGGRAAVEEHRRLQAEIFPEFNLGLLHGRMKAEEKDDVMARFRDEQVHILVSTSVVEVGVDVPNATVMLIEGANRFGLAQLHQFRGRVGRGSEKSYCLLIPENEDSAENERLSVMVETNDGFVLAERDLEQRGPGDFLGTRQAGYGSELRLASLTDVKLIEKARHFAQVVFQKDPDLQLLEHQALETALARSWTLGGQAAGGDIS
jgi:ATP-dependent DNA helicase RecG